MTVIIGIDPGSRRTGYGVIRLEGNRHIHIASGYINLTAYPAILNACGKFILGYKKLFKNLSTA